MENNCDFVIGVKKWQKVFVIVALIVGLAGLVAAAILYSLKIWSISKAWTFLILAFGFTFAGGIGTYSSIKEKCVLSNGVFTYEKPFKKNQSAKVEDVGKVVLKSAGVFVDVIFYGKNGEKLINFYDDGTVAYNVVFADALSLLGIPYESFV